MNFGITLVAIFYIVILIVPGIFFKRFYFQSKFSKEFYKGGFADKAMTSVFWGVVIQIFSILIISTIFDLDFKQVKKSVGSIYESIHENKLPDIGKNQLRFIGGYFLFAIALACLSGHVIHKLVRFFKLDISFSPLRFSNEWNYIFRNETSRKPQESEEDTKYFSTEIDIIVKESKNDIPRFYSGTLKDYFLDDNGNLDKVVLNSAKKRVKKESEAPQFVSIKGDTFIVPYCNVENMNLRYNYIPRTGEFVVPVAIKNTVVIFFVLALIPGLAFPWFTDASIFYKILSMVILFLGWTCIMVTITSLFNKRGKITASQRLRTIIISLVFGILFTLISFFLLGVIKIS